MSDRSEAAPLSWIHGRWLHENPDEHVEFHHELDGARYEIRKVQIFRDGRTQAASHDRSTGDTFLSDEPIPSLDEINTDPQFVVVESTLEIFEAAWVAAMSG